MFRVFSLQSSVGISSTGNRLFNDMFGRMLRSLSLCSKTENQCLQTQPNENMSDNKNSSLIIRKSKLSGRLLQSDSSKDEKDDIEEEAMAKKIKFDR